MFPIYIPSKGRAGLKRGAVEMLFAAEIPHTIVVDPDDYNTYSRWIVESDKSALSLLICTPKNNQGLAYVNEYIRQLSISKGESWHWQINDDIWKFSLRRPKQKAVVMNPGEALYEIESEVGRYSNVGLAGPEEDIWPPTEEPVKINAIPAQAVLINNAVSATFRKTNGFEDIDFYLQVLSQSYCTMQFDNIRISAPKPGTNDGGNEIKLAKRAAYLFQHERVRWPKVQFNPGGSPGGRPSRRWIMKNFTQRPQLITK